MIGWRSVHNVLMTGPPGSGKTLLALTIADLGRSPTIAAMHVAEALQYRAREVA